MEFTIKETFSYFGRLLKLKPDLVASRQAELLKLLQSDYVGHRGPCDRADDDASSSEPESSCDEEIANAMQTSLATRFENIFHNTSDFDTIFNKTWKVPKI